MHTSSTICKQLQPEDLMTIASLRQQNFSIRRIATVLQCSPSTFRRELTRNSEQRTYASVNAKRRCHQRRNLGRT